MLCGHDTGQGEAVPHLRQSADALWTDQLQPPLPLCGGDPPGAPGAARQELPARSGRGRGGLERYAQPLLRLWGLRLLSAPDLRRWPLRPGWTGREPDGSRPTAPTLLWRLCPGHVGRWWRCHRQRPDQTASGLLPCGGWSAGGRRQPPCLPEGGYGPAQGIRTGNGPVRPEDGGRRPVGDCL